MLRVLGLRHGVLLVLRLLARRGVHGARHAVAIIERNQGMPTDQTCLEHSLPSNTAKHKPNHTKPKHKAAQGFAVLTRFGVIAKAYCYNLIT